MTGKKKSEKKRVSQKKSDSNYDATAEDSTDYGDFSEIETLEGIHSVSEDKLIIQKSDPLLQLWSSPLTLAEFKVMDVYMARINSHNPNKREVRFKKGELEELLHVKQIRTSVLEEHLNHLMGTVIKIPNIETRKGYELITLFSRAHVELDDNGMSSVTLRCTDEAMKYFFLEERKRYLRYKLHSIVHLSSRCSYVLFLHIENNRFRKEWDISLPDIKRMLGCDREPTYEQFKFFNRDVLKKCKTELEDKTELRFDYTPIKFGCRVTGIHFCVHRLVSPDFIEACDIAEAAASADAAKEKTDCMISYESAFDEEAVCIENTEDMNDIDYGENELFAEACEKSFTKEEMDEISAILRLIPSSALPIIEDTDDIDLRRYHLLQINYKRMKSYKNKVKYPYQYLLKLIKKHMETNA